MRVALLLYADVAAAAQTTVHEAEAELQRYAEITADMADAGVLRGGEALRPAAEGVHIGGDGDEVAGGVHTDPELSGYYLLECTWEDAMSWARRLPVAHHGRVEIRPLMDLPDPGSSPIQA